MPLNLPTTASLYFALALSLSSCSLPTQPNDPVTPRPYISSQGKALVFHANGNNRTVYQASTDIEALAGTEDWLIWIADDQPSLQLAPFSPTQPTVKPISLPALPHDADLLCVGELADDVLDLFIHDGDHFFYHYWLTPADGTLQPVRRIATNPDITACTVNTRHLIFQDDFIGTLVLDRNPETDSILHRASARQANSLAGISATTMRRPLSTTVQSPYPSLMPALETEPVADTGDAADDPAIMVFGDTTWIAGTNKQRGLAIYDLNGKQLHFSPRGRLNNVDAVDLGQGEFLLTASNRTHKTIDVFTANLTANTLQFMRQINLQLDDPYGLCMAHYDNGIAVFVGDSEGRVEHWQLNADTTGGTLQQHWDFPSQTEGCVLDPGTGQLYVGEENVGIWKIDPATGDRTLIEPIKEGGLVADVEGLDIYHGKSARYLVASSQGEDRYIVFQLQPWKLLGKFSITADIAAGIDGASETDGLAVSTIASEGFPNGILVVQDGRNRAPEQPQNFKVVDWRSLQSLIDQWQQ